MPQRAVYFNVVDGVWVVEGAAANDAATATADGSDATAAAASDSNDEVAFEDDGEYSDDDHDHDRDDHEDPHDDDDDNDDDSNDDEDEDDDDEDEAEGQEEQEEGEQHEEESPWLGPSGKRSRKCGKCEGCYAAECGECAACLDKPKFGGPNTRHQVCVQRKCRRIYEPEVPGKTAPRKRRASASSRPGSSTDRPWWKDAGKDGWKGKWKDAVGTHNIIGLRFNADGDECEIIDETRHNVKLRFNAGSTAEDRDVTKEYLLTCETFMEQVEQLSLRPGAEDPQEVADGSGPSEDSADPGPSTSTGRQQEPLFIVGTRVRITNDERECFNREGVVRERRGRAWLVVEVCEAPGANPKRINVRKGDLEVAGQEEPGGSLAKRPRGEEVQVQELQTRVQELQRQLQELQERKEAAEAVAAEHAVVAEARVKRAEAKADAAEARAADAEEARATQMGLAAAGAAAAAAAEATNVEAEAKVMRAAKAVDEKNTLIRHLEAERDRLRAMNADLERSAARVQQRVRASVDAKIAETMAKYHRVQSEALRELVERGTISHERRLAVRLQMFADALEHLGADAAAAHSSAYGKLKRQHEQLEREAERFDKNEQREAYDEHAAASTSNQITETVQAVEALLVSAAAGLLEVLDGDVIKQVLTYSDCFMDPTAKSFLAQHCLLSTEMLRSPSSILSISPDEFRAKVPAGLYLPYRDSTFYKDHKQVDGNHRVKIATTADGRRVAIKRFTAEQTRACRRELSILHRFGGRGVVPVQGLFVVAGISTDLFLQMPYVGEGTTLASYCIDLRRSLDRLARLDKFLRVMAHLVTTLSWLHYDGIRCHSVDRSNDRLLTLALTLHAGLLLTFPCSPQTIPLPPSPPSTLTRRLLILTLLLTTSPLLLSHRDLKFANVLIDFRGDFAADPQPMLIDFETAKDDACSGHTTTFGTASYEKKGTLGFMPPEGTVSGPKADVWALGAMMLYELRDYIHPSQYEKKQSMLHLHTRDWAEIWPVSPSSDGLETHVAKVQAMLAYEADDRPTLRNLQMSGAFQLCLGEQELTLLDRVPVQQREKLSSAFDKFLKSPEGGRKAQPARNLVLPAPCFDDPDKVKKEAAQKKVFDVIVEFCGQRGAKARALLKMWTVKFDDETWQRKMRRGSAEEDSIVGQDEGGPHRAALGLFVSVFDRLHLRGRGVPSRPPTMESIEQFRVLGKILLHCWHNSLPSGLRLCPSVYHTALCTGSGSPSFTERLTADMGYLSGQQGELCLTLQDFQAAYTEREVADRLGEYLRWMSVSNDLSGHGHCDFEESTRSYIGSDMAPDFSLWCRDGERVTLSKENMRWWMLFTLHDDLIVPMLREVDGQSYASALRDGFSIAGEGVLGALRDMPVYQLAQELEGCCVITRDMFLRNVEFDDAFGTERREWFADMCDCLDLPTLLNWITDLTALSADGSLPDGMHISVRLGNEDCMVPKVHTCIYRLELPAYSSKEELIRGIGNEYKSKAYTMA